MPSDGKRSGSHCVSLELSESPFVARPRGRILVAVQSGLSGDSQLLAGLDQPD